MTPSSSSEPRAPGAAHPSRGPSTWATHAALVFVQIAFASQAVEAKLAMLPRADGGEAVSPAALAMIRMLGGTLFFQASVLFGPADAARPRLRLRTHARLVVLAALGVALNQALFLAGLRASTPLVVSLLGASIPVLAAALAIGFGKERWSLQTGIGLGLALSGVLWLTGIGSAAEADRGAVLVALNCLSYAAYVVFSRDLVLELGAMRFMAWVFTYGTLLFVPIGLVPFAAQLPELGARAWLLLGYIVIVPTILAYGLNAWALGRSTASTVTIYIYLQPLFAAALAWLQLGHRVSSRAGLSSILILGGVGVSTMRRRVRSRAERRDAG